MTDPKEEVYESEVIEDARTGEEIPTGIQKVQSNTLATSLDLTKVGTLEIGERAEAILGEPIKPEEVQIRPDGLVYLPWTWFADRLNRAFGRLGWGLIPQAGPQSRDMGNNVLVVWGHWLVVKGVPVGFEMGECAYRPDNHTMSFGDAAAGAKSNSLARNCKMLGMSLELWNQEWVNDWKKKYAETYEYRGKTFWRKKSSNKAENTPRSRQEAPGATHEEKTTQDTPNGAGMTPGEFLKNVLVIQQIGKRTGKPAVEVIKFLNTLEKDVKFTPEEIEVMIGEQK